VYSPVPPLNIGAKTAELYPFGASQILLVLVRVAFDLPQDKAGE